MTVSLPRRCLAKRAVNLLALSGILVNRLTRYQPLTLLASPAFFLTLGCWALAATKLRDE